MEELAVICAIVKDEDDYLYEWIQYHLSLGFSKIYLYNNSDTSDRIRLKQAYEGDPIINKLVVFNVKGSCLQTSVYNDFLNKYRHLHRWCAFIDADEFIVLKKHKSIIELLTEHCPIGALTLNWYMFGSAGHTHYEDKPVLERFQWRSASVDKHIKTIVEMQSVEEMFVHHCFAMYKYRGFPQDTNGTYIYSPYNPNGPTDIAVIHHYKVKSKEEYEWKIARGRADVNIPRTWEQFHEADLNEVFDDSAWKWYQAHCLQ